MVWDLYDDIPPPVEEGSVPSVSATAKETAPASQTIPQPVPEPVSAPSPSQPTQPQPAGAPEGPKVLPKPSLPFVPAAMAGLARAHLLRQKLTASSSKPTPTPQSSSHSHSQSQSSVPSTPDVPKPSEPLEKTGREMRDEEGDDEEEREEEEKVEEEYNPLFPNDYGLFCRNRDKLQTSLSSGPPKTPTPSSTISSTLISLDQPPVLSVPKDEEMKGYGMGAKMLQKMGWKKGEDLGAQTPSTNHIPPASDLRLVLLENMIDESELDEDFEGDVRQECEKYGTVQSVEIKISSSPAPSPFPSPSSAVCVFVVFLSSADAQKAKQALDGRFFAGRLIKATLMAKV